MLCAEGLQVPCPSLVIVAASADSDHSIISSVVCTFLPAGQQQNYSKLSAADAGCEEIQGH